MTTTTLQSRIDLAAAEVSKLLAIKNELGDALNDTKFAYGAAQQLHQSLVAVRDQQLADAAEREADVVVRDHGTMWGFTGNSLEGGTALEELEAESWQWMGLTLMVDHRPARDLLAHLTHTTDLKVLTV